MRPNQPPHGHAQGPNIAECLTAVVGNDQTGALSSESHGDLHVVTGDSLSVLAHFPDATFDAVVCDPPYAIKGVPDVRAELTRPLDTPGDNQCLDCVDGVALPDLVTCAECLQRREVASFADAAMLGQRSSNWHEKATHSPGYADNDPAAFQRWCALWLAQCFRLLKPGGHLVAFGGTRTWHRVAVAAEDAGFEFRDSLAWLYATGVPKSVNVGRAVEPRSVYLPAAHRAAPTARPATYEWAGWGTTLKPAHEPVVLARKPMTGTVASNLAQFRTGVLNIDGCRIPPPPDRPTEQSRWPTNVFLDDGHDHMSNHANDNRP